MLEVLLAVIAGLLIGSFLNVCIYRMPRDLSIARPSRSFCPACERTIAWYDNVPVLSYVLLRGRCRSCRARIPVRYLLVEILTATSFAVIVLQHGWNAAAAKMMLLAALLIGLIFADLEERILPDEFTLGGAALGLVFAWFAPAESGLFTLLAGDYLPGALRPVLEAAFDGLFAAGLLWSVGRLYQLIRKREGLGLGDVKMMAMVAVYLGLSGAFLTLIIGSLTGSILGLIYIAARGKDASTYELPFGSFLGAAALLVVLAGDPFVSLLAG